MIGKVDDDYKCNWRSMSISRRHLFVTSDKGFKSVNKKAGNSILIKLNQIGTLSETMDTINLAKK